MTNKEKATELGVRAAFDFWLSQHDISFPQICEDAIKAAFKEWLEAHTEEIIGVLKEEK